MEVIDENIKAYACFLLTKFYVVKSADTCYSNITMLLKWKYQSIHEATLLHTRLRLISPDSANTGWSQSTFPPSQSRNTTCAWNLNNFACFPVADSSSVHRRAVGTRPVGLTFTNLFTTPVAHVTHLNNNQLRQNLRQSDTFVYCSRETCQFFACDA